MEGIPHGSMIEVDAALIDEGEMLKTLNTRVRKAFKDLYAYAEDTGDKAKPATVTLTIELGLDADVPSAAHIAYEITAKCPVRRDVGKAYAKAAAGKLLTQPSGAGRGDPDQIQLFDSKGNPTGVVNTTTGEVVKPDTQSTGVVARVGG